MDAAELKRRINRLKREKEAEEERRGLRRMERTAISEAREAKRARRISGIGLAIEKAKVYKALPLPRIRRGDEEERLERAERRAEEAEAKAATQIALSQRRGEVSRARREAVKEEAEQRAAEREEKKARLLSERELRAERLRPYTRVATKTGRVVGKAGLGISKRLIRGIQYLGKEGQKPRKPYEEAPIDLGFGTESKRPERPREEEPKEPPLDLSIKL